MVEHWIWVDLFPEKFHCLTILSSANNEAVSYVLMFARNIKIKINR